MNEISYINIRRAFHKRVKSTDSLTSTSLSNIDNKSSSSPPHSPTLFNKNDSFRSFRSVSSSGHSTISIKSSRTENSNNERLARTFYEVRERQSALGNKYK